MATDKDTNVPNKTDYISLESAIVEIKRFIGYLDEDMIERLQIAIRRIPAADVQPVVLCRECKHYNKDSCLCENRIGLPFANADKFCSMGVRRADHE